MTVKDSTCCWWQKAMQHSNLKTFKLFDHIAMVVDGFIHNVVRFVHFPSPFCSNWICVMSKKQHDWRSMNEFMHIIENSCSPPRNNASLINLSRIHKIDNWPAGWNYFLGKNIYLTLLLNLIASMHGWSCLKSRCMLLVEWWKKYCELSESKLLSEIHSIAHRMRNRHQILSEPSGRKGLKRISNFLRQLHVLNTIEWCLVLARIIC